jgi:hypothetical protein
MKKVSVALWFVSAALISDAIKASVLNPTYEISFLISASLGLAIPLIAVGAAFWAADNDK